MDFYHKQGQGFKVWAAPTTQTYVEYSPLGILANESIKGKKKVPCQQVIVMPFWK